MMHKVKSREGFSMFFVFLFTALAGISCSSGSGPSSDVLAQERENNISPSLWEMQNSFRSIAQNVLPTVVEIQTLSISSPASPATPFGEDFPWEFFFSPQNTPQDTPRQRPQPRQFESRGLGSGVMFKREGNFLFALTNNHVVDGAKEIKILLYDGREFPGVLVGNDQRRDLAVVKFETRDTTIPTAVFGDSSKLEVGDIVLAMGSPLGLGFSVSQGIISALGRRGGPGQNINDFIQTDASINKGNSGGPLVNLQGEIVGINTWIESPTGGSVGLGFAIPINNAKRPIEGLVSGGGVRYGWLGVSIGDMDPDSTTALGLADARGAFIFHLFKNSPASKAGILPGDFVTSLNNTPVKNANELIQMVGELTPGSRAVFQIIRLGERSTKTAVIEERPNEERINAQNSTIWPGFTIMQISDELRNRIPELKDARGLVISGVIERTPAQIAGLREGDLVKAVDGRPVDNYRNFYEALNRGTGELKITIKRENVDVTIGIGR